MGKKTPGGDTLCYILFHTCGATGHFFVTVQSVTFALASVCLWATANFAGLFFASADLRNSELLFFFVKSWPSVC